MAKNNKTEGQTTDRHTTELTEPDSKEGVGAAGHTVAHKARSAGLGPQSVSAWRRHLRQGLEAWYRVLFFNGHIKVFRVWENAIILIDFELVFSVSGFVPGPELNMKKKI